MNEFAQLRQKAGLSIAEAAETVGWSASTVYRWDRGEHVPRRAVIEKLQRVIADRVSDKPAEVGFSFIDLAQTGRKAHPGRPGPTMAEGTGALRPRIIRLVLMRRVDCHITCEYDYMTL